MQLSAQVYPTSRKGAPRAPAATPAKCGLRLAACTVVLLAVLKYVQIAPLHTQSSLSHAQRSVRTRVRLAGGHEDFDLDQHGQQQLNATASSATQLSSLHKCMLDGETMPFPTSFWFVKTFKTGGSTLAGIFRSIGAHYGVVPVPGWAHPPWEERVNMKRLTAGFMQAMNVSESWAISMQTHLQYEDRIARLFNTVSPAEQPRRLLLFTVLRHPVSRVHSSYVQAECTRTARTFSKDPMWREEQCMGADGGNATILGTALRNDSLEARWSYVRKHHKNLNYNYVHGTAKTPEEVVAQYDFIFVQERMAESLVVFMLEYGLRLEDIVHLSAKNRTSKYRTYKHAHELNAYIEAVNSQELALWQLANQRLDQRILALQQRCGRDNLEAVLRAFAALQQEVARECADWQDWYRRHGFDAPFTRHHDQGIAPRCLEHVARRFVAAHSIA